MAREKARLYYVIDATHVFRRIDTDLTSDLRFVFLYKIKEKLVRLDTMKYPKRDGEAGQSKQSTCNYKKK